jgi:dihydroneopterin aldolase
LPQERTVGGDFTVTLRIGYPWEQAMESDDVADTLNYAAVYELVKREMAVPSKLLEHVAGRMAEAICQAFPQVTSIDLELTKLNPPLGADCVGASIEVHFIKD